MHNYLFKIPKSLLSSIRLSLVWLLVMAFSLVSSNSFAKLVTVDTPVVGQVTLLIGDTIVTGPSRKGSARLQAGADIYPGDIIHTRASGHAHLRFIDGALMSVRPSSRLTIEAYNYDPQTPANNRVSFKLEEGIARSISGKAAKDARENFRMNTPVAAIGVRGTDFIVHTSPERTRALVTEGGIVLSGLDTVCVGGWCGELELRSGSQQLLEVDLATNAPRLMRSSFDQVLTSTALNSNIALVQVQAVQEGLLAEHKSVIPVLVEAAAPETVVVPEVAVKPEASSKVEPTPKPSVAVITPDKPVPTKQTAPKNTVPENTVAVVVPVPTTSIPTVSAPTTSAPTVSTPTVSTPTVSAPTTTVATNTSTTVKPPITKPTVTKPTVTAPITPAPSIETDIAASDTDLDSSEVDIELGVAQSGSQVSDSQNSDSQVSDSQISDSQISDSQVSDSQIGDSQVSDSQIGDSQVSDPQVSDSQNVADGSSTSEPQVAGNDNKGSIINNELIDPSDLLIIPEMVPASRALVWGYLNTNNDTLPGFVQNQDTIATLDKTYHKTGIANNAYALYRRNEYDQMINPSLPELQFALNDASAWLNWSNVRESMDVERGILVIDFSRSVFFTQLQLSHDRTGKILFNTSGTTEKTGHFSHSSSNKNLQGVVSLDAKEAAYLFSENLLKFEGNIEGITHWGIKK